MILGCMGEIEPIIRSLSDKELALESRVIAEILCIENFMDSCLMDTVVDYETLVRDEIVRRFCGCADKLEGK